jgi:hypothetical protein
MGSFRLQAPRRRDNHRPVGPFLPPTTNPTNTMKSPFLATLRSNWRDLIAFIIIGIGLACAGGAIDYAAGRYADVGIARLILPPLANYLQGFSRFVGASFSATFLWMLLWPTVSRFGNDSFSDAWKSLSIQQHLLVYFALISVALIAAAICFSA